MLRIWLDITNTKVVYLADIIEIKLRKHWVDETYQTDKNTDNQVNHCRNHRNEDGVTSSEPDTVKERFTVTVSTEPMLRIWLDITNTKVVYLADIIEIKLRKHWVDETYQNDGYQDSQHDYS
ncbi:Uncharacterised protein [Streptococcus pneumoniae]|nr:Uncharacterised protein [Streptococcus pneumoniae]